MQPLANNWHNLTDVQWLVMALCLVAGVILALGAEWLARPRINKWSDWKRTRR